MKKRILSLFLLLAASVVTFAQKPKVWIISDGCDNNLKTPEGKHFTDPDDVSALAAYLLMSNHFDTKGIVVASGNHPELLKTASNQGTWAKEYFGAAYKADLPRLNEVIGGYQSDMPFLESSLKATGEKFSLVKTYKSLKDYPSILALYKVVEKSDDVVNVLCWGTLTEVAIFVNYCKYASRYDILSKVRFISHWTNSSIMVGTKEAPEHVHNCFNDSQACDYMKSEAINGAIQFYECGSIGQSGIVEGAPRGEEYYNQFRSSHLGTIFREGKYVSYKGYVDGSDSATFWVLLGNWGVSLNDIASNGINFNDVEQRNLEIFYKKSPAMHDEMLRRSRVVTGGVAAPITMPNLFPQHGLTDGHVWIDNGRLYLFGGHDESWKTDDTWKMNRWEIWSTDNLRDWRYEKSLHPKDTYIGNQPNCWAGDIVERNGKYYWYFSNRSTDTGVMYASSITGDYVEPLKKPLLPNGIIGKGHPYDPEIVEDNGKYYVIFASGQYYIAELGDDMISLKSEPEKLMVLNSEGKSQWTADKASMFKREGIYYLVWGDKYATSKELKGPYLFQGDFMSGGHTSIFNWYGQWYVIQENKDISLFYRGLSLKPIYFNLDGSIQIPTTDYDYPGVGRAYNFEVNQMGWEPIGGTDVKYAKKYGKGGISGTISGEASIKSATWLMNSVSKLTKFTVTLKNSSNASAAKVYFPTYTVVKGKGAFWKDNVVDWEGAYSELIPLKPAKDGFVEYEISLKGKLSGEQLKALRIDPAVGVTSGSWEIRNIEIK